MTCRARLVLLSAAFIGYGQEIAIRPKFSSGQKLQLTLKKSREHSRAGAATGTSTTPVTLYVAAATSDGFVVRWQYGETIFDNPAMNANPIVAGSAKAARGIELELELSTDGELRSLRNEEDVTRRLGELTSKLAEETAAALPADKRSVFLDLMKKVLSPALLKSSVLRDAGLYFNMNGAELAVGKPVIVPLKVPNPFGGAQIESTLEVQLQSIDKPAGTATLSMRQTFDPGVIAGMGSQIAAAAGVTGSVDARGEMYDSAEFIVDLEKGWMRRVLHRRTIEATNPGNIVRRVDITEILLNQMETGSAK